MWHIGFNLFESWDLKTVWEERAVHQELVSIFIFCFKSGLFRNSHRRCSVEKVFLEISQNSQENTSARVSFLIKLQAGLQLY